MYITQILRKNPLFVLQAVYRYCSPSFLVSPHFMSDDDFIRAIMIDRKSYIRIGDGEMIIMLWGGIFYQKWEPELSETLWKAILEYGQDKHYVLGITEVNFRSNSYLRRIKRLRIALSMKMLFHSYFPKDLTYADAAMFYKKKYIPLLNTFSRQKHIIFVSNEAIISQLQVWFFTEFLSLHTIIAPAEHAFSERNSIIQQIEVHCREKDKDDILIYFSCWPLSKFLVLYFSQLWIQAIDLWLGVELISTHFGEDYSHRL